MHIRFTVKQLPNSMLPHIVLERIFDYCDDRGVTLLDAFLGSSIRRQCFDDRLLDYVLNNYNSRMAFVKTCTLRGATNVLFDSSLQLRANDTNNILYNAILCANRDLAIRALEAGGKLSTLNISRIYNSSIHAFHLFYTLNIPYTLNHFSRWIETKRERNKWIKVRHLLSNSNVTDGNEDFRMGIAAVFGREDLLEHIMNVHKASYSERVILTQTKSINICSRVWDEYGFPFVPLNILVESRCKLPATLWIVKNCPQIVCGMAIHALWEWAMDVFMDLAKHAPQLLYNCREDLCKKAHKMRSTSHLLTLHSYRLTYGGLCLDYEDVLSFAPEYILTLVKIGTTFNDTQTLIFNLARYAEYTKSYMEIIKAFAERPETLKEIHVLLTACQTAYPNVSKVLWECITTPTGLAQ